MAKRREELVIEGLKRLLNGTSRVSKRRAGQIGFRLLSRPRRPAPKPEVKAFLAQANAERMLLAGIPIQTYHWQGKGPGVLLLHGWSSSSGRWSGYYEALRQAGFSIYAFDAPAQGQSGGKNFNGIDYAAVLKDYVEYLDNPPVYWVGHSGGGMAIMYYLSQLDHRVLPKRVVAMSVPAELTDFINKFQNMLSLRNQVVDGIEREFTRRFQLKFSDFSPREYAKDIHIPGLIIHDIGDDLAPIQGAEDIYENWRKSCLIVTEGLGHTLDCGEVVELVTDYLLLEDHEVET